MTFSFESSTTTAPTKAGEIRSPTQKPAGTTPSDTLSSTANSNRPVEPTIWGAIEHYHFQNFVQPENENCEKRPPKCIIIGVPNAGVRELRDFLKLNPYIQVYEGDEQYFLNDDVYKQGYEWLRNEMPCSYSSQVTVAENEEYFHSSIVPPRIYKFDKSTKLILVVKEPINRSISHFNELFGEISVPKPIQYSEVVLDSKRKGLNTLHPVLNMSIYDDNTYTWLRYFNLSQFHIVESERLTRDPAAVLAEIETFLGLGHFIHSDMFVFNQEKVFPCIRSNISSTGMACYDGKDAQQYASPETVASPDLIALLKRYFQPRNTRFFKMIGQQYAW